mgnify:CR=1 FL=1
MEEDLYSIIERAILLQEIKIFTIINLQLFLEDNKKLFRLFSFFLDLLKACIPNTINIQTLILNGINT